MIRCVKATTSIGNSEIESNSVANRIPQMPNIRQLQVSIMYSEATYCIHANVPIDIMDIIIFVAPSYLLNT